MVHEDERRKHMSIRESSSLYADLSTSRIRSMMYKYKKKCKKLMDTSKGS
jgi:hypothetical protein